MAYVRANMFYEQERWSKPLLFSAVFHGALALSIIVVGFVIEHRNTSNWGENNGEAVSAVMVSSAPIPIPQKEQSDNIVAHESKGVTQTQPQPKPIETEDGISIPGKVKPQPPKTQPQKTVTAKNVPPRPVPTPETAVPYGEGPPVTGPYGAISAPNMSGGFSFQNADFGSKYAWYVKVVRDKVKQNWLTYEIDPSIKAPHRAYIGFDIARDGSPGNVHLEQTSGVPSLDQSAVRAIQRVDTFGPLPEGNRVTVEFWFDYPPR